MLMKVRIKNYLQKSIVPLTMCFIFLSCQHSVAQQKQVYDFEKDFGGKGDGQSNNYLAFQKAAKALSGRKNLILNFPKGIYLIKDYKVENGLGKNNITDINFTDMENVIINGNGSSINVNGNFKRSADYKLPGVSFDYAYKNTVSPFTLTNCKKLVLKNFKIDGGVMQMTRDKNVVEGFCYGVSISDYLPNHNSGDILIDSMLVQHFSTDGLFLRGAGKNFQVKNSTFKNNGRQGFSMVRGKDVLVYNSNFDSTGFTGNYLGHSPQGGIDVENEYKIEELNNIKIMKSNFRHNNGFQFVSTSASGSVVLDSCFFADLTNGYGNGFNGIGMYSANSEIKNSIIYGMFQVETANETYRGNVPLKIQNNIIYSGISGLLSSDYNTPINISGNILVMLPSPIANQYFPFIRNSNAVFSNNMIITHPDKMQTHNNQFTGLLQSVKQADDNFWFVYGKSKNAARPSNGNNTFYKIATDNSKLVGNQFVPADKVNTAIGKGKALRLNDLTDLMRYEFITNYGLKNFSPVILQEAAQLRQQMKMISAR